MSNKFKPEVDRVLKISIDMLIRDTEESLTRRTLHVTELPSIGVTGKLYNILSNQIDDVLKNKSFVITEGFSIEGKYALVEVEEHE